MQNHTDPVDRDIARAIQRDMYARSVFPPETKQAVEAHKRERQARAFETGDHLPDGTIKPVKR